MASKANPDQDCNRELDHELQVAHYLAVAFIAQSHEIGMDYARKKYAGSFWVDIARQVIAHMAQRGWRPDFSATIQ
jgi:hypothetical protein